MQISSFITRKILFGKEKTFSGFIIIIAIAATALSVATMVVTLSMVNGFQHEVSSKVYSFWGHARIQNLDPVLSNLAEEAPFTYSDSIKASISLQPIWQHYQAFASKSVVLRSANQFEGVMLKGIDSNFLRSGFERFLKQGKMPDYGDSIYGRDILLSEKTAARLMLSPGDTVNIFFLRTGEDIRMRRLRISGLFRTGIEEYDQGFAIVDLRFLQRLNNWQTDEVGGVELLARDIDEVYPQASMLNKLMPQGIIASPVREIYPNIFDWLSIQDQTKRVVIGMMLIVAIINLVTCLLIMLMERTRMIALFTALGMTASGIRRIFWSYVMHIAVAGIGLGLLLGLGLLWLQDLTGFIKMDETTYYVSEMPVHIVWWQIGLIAAGTFVVCLASLFFPLLFFRQVPISKALQFK